MVVDHSPQAGPEEWWTGGASQTSVLSLLSQLLERVRQWPAAWPWNPRPILAIIQGSVGMPTTATTLSFAMEA